MKNCILILLLFITGTTYGQLNTEPPKIITEIDEKVREINNTTDSSGNVSVSGEFMPDELRSVKLIDNRIAKIEGARKTDSLLIIYKFYFSYNKLIYAYEKCKDRFSFIVLSKDSFYYDYDELVSTPKVLFTEKDTIYPHFQLQKRAYRLYEKHRDIQNYNPFKNIQYNRVLAYDYEGRGDRLIIDFYGKLDKSAVLPGKVLTNQLQELLINTITDTASYGGTKAGCFDPHLGIVFYMNDSITAHVSICFECNSLYSSVYLPAEAHNLQVDSGDDYYFVRPMTGFSPAGRKQLKQLCQELGLGKCPAIDEIAIWD